MRENAMKGRKNRLNAGETLAEAMVSALLFLLMMALIQGAVSFCSNAQKKSAQLREQNALICSQLRGDDSPGEATGETTLSFRAVSADGSQTGQLVFVLPVELRMKTVFGGEGGPVRFYLFAPKEGTGGSPP